MQRDEPALAQDTALGTRAALGLIVVAAGRAQRMGRDKLWEPLGERPLVAQALVALAAPPVVHVALVVADDRLVQGRALASTLPVPAVVVPGGARRQDSVRNGLLALGPCGWIAVHDAARPFAAHTLLLRVLAAAQATGAAVPALRVADTVKRVRDGTVVETLARADLWAAQTPQVFRRDLLERAHREVADDATDDAAMVERLGVGVRIVEGAYNNLKVTTPHDLAIAVWLLRTRRA